MRNEETLCRSQSSQDELSKTIPGLFLNSKRATKGHRLLMSISELRDLAGDGIPAPDYLRRSWKSLSTEVLDFFEAEGGFYFYDHDEMEEQLQHLSAEAKKAREELNSFKMKAAKE
jgi:hypothetical protein